MTARGEPTPDRWRHRRRMAYASLAGMLSFPALAVSVDAGVIEALVWPVYISLGGIVSVYTGASTYDDVKIGVQR